MQQIRRNSYIFQSKPIYELNRKKIMRWILVPFFYCCCSATDRVVLTFDSIKNAQDAYVNVDITNFTIVKQYGRRILLNLHRNYETKDNELLKNIYSSYQIFVEPDAILSGLDIPWNLRNDEPFSIKIENLWHSRTETEVVVAVIDSGISESSRSAFQYLLQGYDFISDEDISSDGDGRDPVSFDPGPVSLSCPVASWHGTKVASIIAAQHLTGVYVIVGSRWHHQRSSEKSAACQYYKFVSWRNGCLSRLHAICHQFGTLFGFPHFVCCWK